MKNSATHGRCVTGGIATPVLVFNSDHTVRRCSPEVFGSDLKISYCGYNRGNVNVILFCNECGVVARECVPGLVVCSTLTKFSVTRGSGCNCLA